MFEHDANLSHSLLTRSHLYDSGHNTFTDNGDSNTGTFTSRLQMIPFDPKHREKMRIVTFTITSCVGKTGGDDKLINSIVKGRE